MPTPEEIYKFYLAAWNEKEESARNQLLEQCWSEDGVISSPRAVVAGRRAVNEHIGRILNQVMPGHAIVSTSGTDVHHNYLRSGWEIRSQEGKVVLSGVDFGEFNEAGLLKSITEFYGPLPSLQTEKTVSY